MKKDINICRIRRENNLPCCNCICDECPEKRKPKTKERKHAKPVLFVRHERTKWSKEEDALAADLSLTAREVSEMTGRSLQAVCKYRAKHRYFKILQEGKKNENEQDLHQRPDLRDQ